ncbi:hypothetical protein OESDEN_16898 [Oesophagostomum dentatum]|uniref:Uncharacterized protein n=1 Tax=Oesophagostomum dentatum TaxID=61180 RepID=A0A0B1SJJ3_OESDE|nr:hypothetical protein OESDEN_16898 [Oesophagostomum dentatum]
MYPRRGNDFSSIARRLLLGRDHTSDPHVSFRSIGVARDSKPTNSAVKVDVNETVYRVPLTHEHGTYSEVPSCSFAHGREIKAEADDISEMKRHDDEVCFTGLLLKTSGSPS